MLGRRDFRLFIAGQALSIFGDTVALIALGVWVKVLTGSSSAAGLVLLAYTAPVLLMPAGGFIADRVRRKPLLVWTCFLTAAAAVPLTLVTDRSEIWIIYCVAVCFGLASVLTSPAQSALLRSILLDEAEFGSAAGISQSVRAGTTLLAPVVGSTFFSWAGGRNLALVDIAILTAAGLAFLALPVRESVTRAVVGESWRTQATAGFRHIRRSGVIRPLLLAMVAVTAVLGMTQPMLFALIEHGLHRPAELLGVLESVLAVGSLAGALAGGLAIRRLNPHRMVQAGALLFGAGTLLLLVPSLPVVLTGLLIAGAGGPISIVGLATAAQAATPASLMGRTQAAVNLCLTVPQAASIGVGSALVAVISFRYVIGLMALGAAVTAAALIHRTPHPRPSHRASGSPPGCPEFSASIEERQSCRTTLPRSRRWSMTAPSTWRGSGDSGSVSCPGCPRS